MDVGLPIIRQNGNCCYQDFSPTETIASQLAARDHFLFADNPPSDEPILGL
jgi:hypothetical protein